MHPSAIGHRVEITGDLEHVEGPAKVAAWSPGISGVGRRTRASPTPTTPPPQPGCASKPAGPACARSTHPSSTASSPTTTAHSASTPTPPMTRGWRDARQTHHQ
ncbi:hypothetical protein [Saccharopolyspora erythraea]|uniref:hypothetical protein n=1 Tax=Saccharopolyspora erythraea TaxID=1836 RepID=UPI003BEED7AA